jgi:hypothetical protein
MSQLALQVHSKTSETPIKTYHHLMRFVRMQFTKPQQRSQPRSLALPARVWARQSALIMSLHEKKH